MRRVATITAVAAGLLAIPAAASAHPGFNPNQLPAGATVESTLVIPHGCSPEGGMPMGDDAEAIPTVELALQKTAGITIEPGAVEGWDVADDGEAWVWSDAGGATTDVIELPTTITVDGSAGDDIWIRAFQECEDGSAFQWIATPEEEATWPAVYVAVSDGEIGNASAPEDVGQSSDMDHGGMDMEDGEMEMTDEGMADDEMEMTDEEMTDEEMADEEMAMSDEQPSDDETDVTDEASSDDSADDEAAMEEAAAEDGGLSPALVALLVVVLLAAVGGGLVLKRRNG